jgi:hypothetical protein
MAFEMRKTLHALAIVGSALVLLAGCGPKTEGAASPVAAKGTVTGLRQGDLGAGIVKAFQDQGFDVNHARDDGVVIITATCARTESTRFVMKVPNLREWDMTGSAPIGAQGRHFGSPIDAARFITANLRC